MKRILLIISLLSLTFTQELKVEGDLNVTVDIYVNGGVSVPIDKEIRIGNHSIEDVSIQTNFRYNDNAYMKVASSDIYSPTELTLAAGRVTTNVPHFLKEIASADIDQAGFGQLWVKNDVPNNLYFTDDTGQDVQITNNGSLASSGGGTHYWQFTTGGYKSNMANTTTYYFQYRPNNEAWNNSESTPTSINQYDAPAAQFHAIKDGSVTNIRVSGYANDTGAADDFKFYVYKGAISNDGTNTSLTLIATTSAITVSSSLKTFMSNTDISSSNTFSEGDALWVMVKKDAHTANLDIYFTVTVSGEYS